MMMHPAVSQLITYPEVPIKKTVYGHLKNGSVLPHFYLISKDGLLSANL